MVGKLDTHRKASKSQEIFEALQAEIVSNQLKPGTPIDKALLCDRFQVSRSPVTDALNRLAEVGLIDVYPQHGTFVSKIDPKTIHQLAFVRECIEVGIMRQLSGRLSDAQLEQLETNLRIQGALAEAKDNKGFYRYDKEFHDLLLRFSGQLKAAEIMRSVLTQLERARIQIMPLDHSVADAFAEHRAILASLRSGDPQHAADVMRKHLTRAMTAVDQVLAEHPELLY